MEEMIARLVDDMVARTTGPLHFRLILQPLMACIFAVIAGLKDAKAGRPAYLWGMFTRPDERREMMKEGWKQVGKIFILAIVLDVAYQFIVEGFVYPFEVVFVAFILAILPYLIVRGIVNRIASLI
jgi:hypothetical protein